MKMCFLEQGGKQRWYGTFNWYSIEKKKFLNHCSKRMTSPDMAREEWMVLCVLRQLWKITKQCQCRWPFIETEKKCMSKSLCVCTCYFHDVNLCRTSSQTPLLSWSVFTLRCLCSIWSYWRSVFRVSFMVLYHPWSASYTVKIYSNIIRPLNSVHDENKYIKENTTVDSCRIRSDSPVLARRLVLSHRTEGMLLHFA